MDTNNKISRRKFLSLSLVGVTGVALISLNPFGKSNSSQWRFFTNGEGVLVDALAEQIIPTDESMGARDAGATNFIDKQLMGPYKRHQDTYRKGLKAIQETCQTKYKKRFEQLEWDDQTVFLQTMEAGKMEGSSWKDEFDKEFFGMIRSHTMQSFYGSPRHGGNKNNVSYKMMRIDYPVIIGQNRYKI